MSDRYVAEKAKTLNGVSYVGPLEYVADTEFKPGHPPRRLTATEAAAALHDKQAQIDRLKAELAEKQGNLEVCHKACKAFREAAQTSKAKREQAEAELAEALDVMRDRHADLRTRVAELEAELAEARKDTARLDWMEGEDRQAIDNAAFEAKEATWLTE